MSKAAKRKWTFMVYLSGDNSLASAGLVDLNEMKKVGSNDGINVVAQFDNGKGHRTLRYVLSKGGSLDKDVVKNLGKTNTGDTAVLIAFINWAVTSCPADHYALVVWNHGNGWDDEDIYRSAVERGITPVRRGTVVEKAGRKRVGFDQLRVLGQNRWRRALFVNSLGGAIADRGIAYDDNARDFLDNAEMKTVVAAARKAMGHKVDILGMDACLMSMVEVIYELRNSISYTVGSEETEPGDGWPYDTILQALSANPDIEPRDFAAAIAEKYAVSYSDDQPVTQAACDVTVLQSVIAALNDLAKKLSGSLLEPVSKSAILQARVQAQAYERADYIDLADFCLLLAADPSVPQLVVPCQNVVQAVQKAVVGYSGTGDRKANSHGLSIYFPMKATSQLYKQLDFCSSCTWDEFLTAFASATRAVRPVPLLATSYS
jgi:hypothetical protein